MNPLCNVTDVKENGYLNRIPHRMLTLVGINLHSALPKAVLVDSSFMLIDSCLVPS